MREETHNQFEGEGEIHSLLLLRNKNNNMPTSSYRGNVDIIIMQKKRTCRKFCSTASELFFFSLSLFVCHVMFVHANAMMSLAGRGQQQSMKT